MGIVCAPRSMRDERIPLGPRAYVVHHLANSEPTYFYDTRRLAITLAIVIHSIKYQRNLRELWLLRQCR